MNHRYSTLLLAGLPLFSLGQITLTQSSNAPAVGNQFMVDRQTSYMQPGPAGNGQTWDFSMLTADGTATYHVENSSGIAGTHLVRSDVDSMYYTIQNDGMYLVREKSIMNAPGVGAEQVTVNYTGTGVRTLAFTATSGTTWTSPVNGNYMLQGEAFTRVGTLTGNADGSGTVTLPSGTYGSILRVHTLMSTQENGIISGLSITGTRKHHEWAFYADWLKHPLVRVVADTISVTSPFPTSIPTAKVEWLQDTQVGLMEAMENNAEFGVWPTPAIATLNITLPANITGSTSARLFDLNGRVVREWAIRNAGNSVVDVTGLHAGQYSLRVISDGRVIGDRKVMIAQ